MRTEHYENYTRQQDLREFLCGMLWDYAVSHRKNSSDSKRYIIVFGENVHVTTCHYNYPMCPYFDDEDVANEALEKIVKPFMGRHPEFVW